MNTYCNILPGCSDIQQETDQTRWGDTAERPQGSQQRKSWKTGELPASLLPTPDMSKLPGQAYLWNATSTHNQVHGICYLLIVQLWCQSAWGIFAHQIVSDSSWGGNKVSTTAVNE